MFKKISISKSFILVLSVLITLSSVFSTLVIAKQNDRSSFRGVASGGTDELPPLDGPVVLWGAFGYPPIPTPFGDLKYFSPLENSILSIDGTGLLGDEIDPSSLPDNPQGSVYGWKFNEMDSSASMSAKWIDDEEQTNKLKIKFDIDVKTDCIYWSSWVNSPPSPPLKFMEVLSIGVNLAHEDPYPSPGVLPLRWDPKYATIKFEGTHNDEEIKGKAIISIFHFPDHPEQEMLMVNLWLEDDQYVGFSWSSIFESVKLKCSIEIM